MANPPTTTQDLATQLATYFRALNPVPNVGFIAAGYDGTAPWVVSVGVAGNNVGRVNWNAQANAVLYGIARGGDTAIVDRLLSQQQFNPPFQVMNLQDAVDYSRHLIRSTIDQLRFEPRFPSVGGPIDTLVVAQGKTEFLRLKKLQAS